MFTEPLGDRIPHTEQLHTFTWQERKLTVPFLEISGDAKTTFSFKKHHFLTEEEQAEGLTEMLYDGSIAQPLVIKSFKRKAPLYIVIHHENIIDVLEHAKVSKSIGSIQFDQHRDLARTDAWLPVNHFEAAFNDELIHRGIFSPDRILIGIPYRNDKDSVDDPTLIDRVQIERIDERYNAAHLIRKVGKPYIHHVDLDMLRGLTNNGNRYTLKMCTPNILIDNAAVTMLITSPSFVGEFTEREIEDINRFVRNW